MPRLRFRLLPENIGHGWAPYTWLAYFGFFFIDPIANHAGWKEWLWTGIGTAFFLVLYFGFFWVEDKWQRLCIGLFVLLGIIYGSYNGGAAVFFTYAAAFIPFAFEEERNALWALAVLPIVAVTEWRLFHLPIWFLVYAGILPLVVGGSNFYFAGRDRMYAKLRRANEEIEHLAKVAERERIARDLHDVLGHTLSVIILKSELAGKLIDRDPERAKAEIADVEQTSRAALAEVRSTIRGYRLNSLQSELKQATSALKAAGVQVNQETADPSLTPSQESVLALVIREAVTNVVRHASAKQCSVRLASSNGNCILEVQDDGCGGLREEGNGVRGMRERVEALGGTLRHENNAGTKLIAQFPLDTTSSNGNHECDEQSRS